MQNNLTLLTKLAQTKCFENNFSVCTVEKLKLSTKRVSKQYTKQKIGLQFLTNGISYEKWHFSCFSLKRIALFMKSTWKATKTTDSTQIAHFDLVFHRVQREGQLGVSYIMVVFGGAHVCLVEHVCVHGGCMHTYVGLLYYKISLQIS